MESPGCWGQVEMMCSGLNLIRVEKKLLNEPRCRLLGIKDQGFDAKEQRGARTAFACALTAIRILDRRSQIESRKSKRSR